MKVKVRDVTRGTDQYGDSTDVETDRWWDVFAIAPRTSTERTDPRTPAVITGKTVYARTMFDLSPNDRLWIDGKWYQVEGDPGVWRSPWSGELKGVEVAVSRWEQP